MLGAVAIRSGVRSNSASRAAVGQFIAGGAAADRIGVVECCRSKPRPATGIQLLHYTPRYTTTPLHIYIYRYTSSGFEYPSLLRVSPTGLPALPIAIQCLGSRHSPQTQRPRFNSSTCVVLLSALSSSPSIYIFSRRSLPRPPVFRSAPQLELKVWTGSFSASTARHQNKRSKHDPARKKICRTGITRMIMLCRVSIVDMMGDTKRIDQPYLGWHGTK